MKNDHVVEYCVGTCVGLFLGLLTGLFIYQGTQQAEWDEAMTPRPVPQLSRTNKTSAMTATFYGRKYHGRKTASGARFDKDGLTAAHRTLPFGTRLLVEHAGRQVEVTITDRGPLAWTGRDLDLSEAAFAQLAPLSKGVIKVLVREVL